MTSAPSATIVAARRLSRRGAATGVNYAMRAAAPARGGSCAEDLANGKTAESDNAAPPPGSDVRPGEKLLGRARAPR